MRMSNIKGQDGVSPKPVILSITRYDFVDKVKLSDGRTLDIWNGTKDLSDIFDEGRGVIEVGSTLDASLFLGDHMWHRFSAPSN